MSAVTDYVVGQELAQLGLRAAPFQVFDPLDGPTEDALRASIRRWGVLVPVVVDQHGRIIDGHHRAFIAHQLGVSFERQVITVADDAEAEEIAVSLNTDRRQLDPSQRRLVVADLREQGHSQRAIAGALGVTQPTVRDDLATIARENPLSGEIATKGLDGKTYGKPPELKRCSSCGDEKPLESFGRDKTNPKDGRGFECRVCASERLKAGERDKVLIRHDSVKRLRESGMTRSQIAEQLGVTERTISSDFAALGLDARPAKSGDPRVARKLARQEQVRRLYVDDGLSCAQIAERLGVNSSTIQNDVKELDIARDDRSADATREREETVRRMAAESYTSAQISKTVGRSGVWVRGTARRLGIEIPADKAVGVTRRIDPTRVVEEICLDAVNVTAAVDVIDLDYGELDPDRMGEWISSLEQSIKSLQAFKRRLIKELTYGRD